MLSSMWKCNALAPLKVPIIDWLPMYTKELFMSDLSAGLTVFVLLVPQSMAYALLVGLPPIFGLYSSTVPLYIYALLGTSREISMGPVAITSLLLGVTCQKFGFEDGSENYIQIAMNATMLVGITTLIVGVCRMGALINLLSNSVLGGFISASALVIFINQIKYLFGLKVPRFSYIHQTLWYLVTHIQESNGYATALGLLSCVFLLSVRELKKRSKGFSTEVIKVIKIAGNVCNFVAILMGMAAAKIIMSSGGSLPIVGEVPSGMRTPGFSFVDFPTLIDLVPDSMAIAFVTFAQNWAVAKKFAAQFKYQVDATQELMAEGMTNIMGVLFGSFVVAGGLARSAVNAESGAKTQIAGCITATCILISILAFTSFLYYIPMASLGAVINVSIIPLINVQEIFATYKKNKKDCLVMTATFLCTLFIGVTEGLFVGILVSSLLVLQNSAFPHVAHLGQVSYCAEEDHALKDSASLSHVELSLFDDTPYDDKKQISSAFLSSEHGVEQRFYYRDVQRFPEAMQLPGIAIVRMDASLYYANCDFFRDTVKRAAAGEFHTSRQPIKHVIVDASGWSDIDLAGIEALFEIKKDLVVISPSSSDSSVKSTEKVLSLVNVKGKVRDRLRHSRFIAELNDPYLQMNIDDAVYMRYSGTSSATSKINSSIVSSVTPSSVARVGGLVTVLDTQPQPLASPSSQHSSNSSTGDHSTGRGSDASGQKTVSSLLLSGITGRSYVPLHEQEKMVGDDDNV